MRVATTIPGAKGGEANQSRSVCVWDAGENADLVAQDEMGGADAAADRLQRG